VTDLLEQLTTALAGRYTIQQRIGSGGMATVYHAEDVKHHRPVAVKVLRPELAAALGPDRFLREIEITARLSHPHVLPLLDSGVANGVLYYVMPYVAGDSLRRRLDRDRQLPLEDALQVVREVADALGYAHSHGVIHRDIKPENILFLQGHATLADFGIAKAITTAGGTRLSTTGLVLGTPGYMSPEQSAGTSDLDGRSDIYSLGCVLYEMLAGEPPFTGPSAESIARQHLSVEAPPVTYMRPNVPPEVARVVARCLAKAPADRFQSALELTGALSSRTMEIAATPAREAARSTGASDSSPSLARAPRKLVAMALVVLAGLGAWWALRGRAAGTDSITAATEGMNGLVVLPLRNLAADPEQEYFADGMTDALISNLASLNSVRVISRTSSMHFKGSTKTLPEIARELKVVKAVDGAVLQSEGKIRITVSLIDALADRPIWSHVYMRPNTHVLALQSEVARDIAEQIDAVITPESAARLADTAAVDPETHRLYLHGRFRWYRRTPDDLLAALTLFQQATARDSTFAPAYTGIADSYGLLGCCGYDVYSPKETMPKAKDAARHALRLNPNLAGGHTSLAWVEYNYEWNWQAAEAELRRALQLNSGYSTARMWLSGLLGVLGRSNEAIEESRKALNLDPLALIVSANVGLQLYDARRHDEAIAQLRSTLEIDSTFPIAVLWLAKAHFARGELKEGAAFSQRFLDLTGGTPFSLAFRGYAYARLGEDAKALAIIDRLFNLRRQKYIPAYNFAVVYTALGRTDEAMLWLERAFDERSDFLIYLGVDPIFDPLRGDARFRRLVRRVGLPVFSVSSPPDRSVSPLRRSTSASRRPDARLHLGSDVQSRRAVLPGAGRREGA
jgi:eukaryotic-like serine/threonine-protein kinase